MSTNFLAPGAGLLILSLLTTLLAPDAGGVRTTAFVGWVTTSAFWVGILLVAAHLLQEVLREHRE